MILIRLKLVTLALIGAALCGCSPSGRTHSDEEKESHFQAGRARVNAMDYKGAIASFMKALEVNPRSAAAHFELGLLYEKNELDYAAAIYHFQRFLELRPTSDYADIVKQRILACKQELAKSVSLGPLTQTLQRDLDRLAEENRRLRDEVEIWRAQYGSRTPPTGDPTGASASGRSQPPTAGSEQSVPRPPGQSDGGTGQRTHRIQPGDTPSGIARKYGVKLEALLAVNPGLNPRRLQIGQSINIPRQ